MENYTAFDYPFDRIKRLYDINVHGAFFTAREAARNMIPVGGGSIVLVSSMSANVSRYFIYFTATHFHLAIHVSWIAQSSLGSRACSPDACIA